MSEKTVQEKLENSNSTETVTPVVETKTPATEAKPAEVKNDKTLEQVIDSSTGQNDHDDEVEKKTKTWKSIKKELKQRNADVEELKDLVTQLATIVESDKREKLSEAKIKAFAEKRGVDPESIRELAELLRTEDVQTPSKKVATVSKQSKPKDDDEDDDDEDEDEEPKKKPKGLNRDRLSRAVDSMVADFLADIPEYAEIVDVNTIKELILANPNKYATKTISEIVDEIYGKALKGRGGIESIKSQNRETTRNKPGNKLTAKDFEDMQNDPTAMKEYKSNLIERARKFGLN